MQRQKFPERHTGLGFPRRVFDADSSSIHGFFPFSTVSFKVDPGFIHSSIHSFIHRAVSDWTRRPRKKKRRGRTVTSLHGDLPQIARDAAIASAAASATSSSPPTSPPRPGPTRVELVVRTGRRARAQGGSSGSAGARFAARCFFPSRPGARRVARLEREANRGDAPAAGEGRRGEGGPRRRPRRAAAAAEVSTAAAAAGGRRDVIVGRARRRGERGGRAGCEGGLGERTLVAAGSGVHRGAELATGGGRVGRVGASRRGKRRKAQVTERVVARRSTRCLV